jgi:hypothetical protein
MMGSFLFTTMFTLALRPTQTPTQWVQGALTLEEKRPVSEADHSPPSISKVKNAWRYTSTPQYAFMAWFLIRQQIFLHGVVLN